MPERKLMIYPKNSSRPIMLTDKHGKESIQDLKRSLEEIFQSDKIFTIATSDDLLLGKPSEVGFIQVKSQNEFENFDFVPKKKIKKNIPRHTNIPTTKPRPVIEEKLPTVAEAMDQLDVPYTDPALQEVLAELDEEVPEILVPDYELVITDD